VSVVCPIIWLAGNSPEDKFNQEMGEETRWLGLLALLSHQIMGLSGIYAFSASATETAKGVVGRPMN
jgi:hypothetical protein